MNSRQSKRDGLIGLAVETSADEDAEQIAEHEAAEEMGGHGSGSEFGCWASNSSAMARNL